MVGCARSPPTRTTFYQVTAHFSTVTELTFLVDSLCHYQCSPSSIYLLLGSENSIPVILSQVPIRWLNCTVQVPGIHRGILGWGELGGRGVGKPLVVADAICPIIWVICLTRNMGMSSCPSTVYHSENP